MTRQVQRAAPDLWYQYPPMASLTRPGRPSCTSVVAAVALGGAAGALLRHGVDVVAPVPPLGFPWPTLVVNTTGSAALAALLVVTAVQRRPVLRAFLGPGLLGGWTTLSTYAEQGRRLLEAGRPGLALGYLLGTVAACLVGCVLGAALARSLGAGADGPVEVPDGGAPR